MPDASITPLLADPSHTCTWLSPLQRPFLSLAHVENLHLFKKKNPDLTSYPFQNALPALPVKLSFEAARLSVEYLLWH